MVQWGEDMELKCVKGDYVPDGKGGVCRLTGAEEVLGRVLFRLTARRGGFPLLPGPGSRLHLLLREKPSARQALAGQYVVQALEDEPELKVTAVALDDAAEPARLTVRLDWLGKPLTAELEL